MHPSTDTATPAQGEKLAGCIATRVATIFSERSHALGQTSLLQTPRLSSAHIASCATCGLQTLHIRQHYNKVRHQHHPDILPTALRLSQGFKSHLARGRSCRWCRSTVGAPGRHSTQCAVLNQLLIAVEYCKQGLHLQDDPSRPGGQHLRSSSEGTAARTNHAAGGPALQDASRTEEATPTRGMAEARTTASPMANPRNLYRRHRRRIISWTSSPGWCSNTRRPWPRSGRIRATSCFFVRTTSRSYPT